MAFTKKKKQRPLTIFEKAWIDEKLNAHKKFNKQFKGEIVFKAQDLHEEVMFTSRYNTDEELQEDAKKIVASMNEISKGKLKWMLVSAKLVVNTSKPGGEVNED